MKQQITLSSLLATFAFFATISHADQDWDGDNSVGNFSFNNNWFGDSQPAWGFGSGNFNIQFRNASATSLFYDYGAFVNTNNITWSSTFNGATSLDGNGQGINFNQKLENQSSFTQTVGSTMNLSGAKNGATKIELNPVNGDLTINGNLFNDNSRPYEVWGNNAKVLTLGKALGTGATPGNVSLTVQQNSTVTVTAAQTYMGGTILNAGVMNLGVGGAAGAVRGVLTVNTGATANTTAVDALGYDNNTTRVSNVNVVGGTFNNSTAGNQGFRTDFALTGGTVSSTGGGAFNFTTGFGITSNANATAATWSAPINIRDTANLPVSVADGAAATDLEISGAIVQANANSQLTKSGAGNLLLSNLGNSFSGNLTVSAGKISTGTAMGGGTTGYLGAVNGTRTVTIGTGASIDFLSNNVFGGSGKTAATIPAIVINGGTLNATKFNILGNLTLNAGTLAQSSTDVSTYQGYQFLGSVTVGGSAASTISTGNAKANHLRGGASTTFTVADATTSTAVDLTVSAPLMDGSGDYTGAGALIKDGAGTMALTAINTHTGGTTVNAGALNLSAGGTAGAVRGALTVNTGATVNATITDALGYTVGTQVTTVNITGGTFNNSTAGNQGFSTNFNLTNGTVSSTGGGAVNFDTGFGITTNASATTSTWSAPITIRGGTLGVNTALGTVPSGIDLTISGTVGASGALGLAKNGTGTLAISSNATYTGGTTINAGTLALTGGGGVTGTIRGAVTVNTGGTLRLAVNDATGYSAGTDRVTSIDLNGGTLHVSTTANQTFATAPITMTGGGITGIAGSNIDLFNNGTNITTNASATTSTISIPSLGLRQNDTTFTVADGAAAVDLQVSSAMGDSFGEGNNALIKAGAGLMAVSGNNSYTGATSVNAGTLRVDTNNALGSASSGTSVANGAALVLNGVNYSTAEALSLNGSGISNGGALVNTGTSTYAGTITAATNATINASGGTLTTTGGLVKDGTTLTIAGGGKVIVNGTGISGASASSDLVVDGTTLVVNAASNYNGPTTVQNSGTLVANAAVTTTQMTVSANSSLSGTGSITTAGGADYVYLNGTLQVGDSTLGSPTASALEFKSSGASGSTVLATGGSSFLMFDLFANAGNNNANAAAADRIRLFGTLDSSMGGTLVIGNPNALTGFALLNSWTLFDLTGGGSISHSLALDYSALNLGSGLSGSFDRTTGIFSVVPEPSRGLLLMIGVGGLLLRRRRIA